MSELIDRIDKLIDRACAGPDCGRIVSESSPSEDFCSERCGRRWQRHHVGVEADWFGEPIIPSELQPDSSTPQSNLYTYLGIARGHARGVSEEDRQAAARWNRAREQTAARWERRQLFSDWDRPIVADPVRAEAFEHFRRFLDRYEDPRIPPRILITNLDS